MFRFGNLLSFIVLVLLPGLSRGADCHSDSLARSVASLLEAYPEATLLDIYKSAFQNRFGPGHIAIDTARSRAYLDWELTQPPRYEGLLYEPTIPDGAFVRVDLRTITQGIVPYELFFDTFLESAAAVEPPTVEVWAADWHEILAVVIALRPDLPGLAADAAAIDERLAQGIFQGEHSDRYVELYDPHYRIIEHRLFDDKIRPLIDNRK